MLDFSRNFRVVLMINVLAILFFFVAGTFFFRVSLLIRPQLEEAGVIQGASILQLITTFILVLILHELVHALFFSIVTGENPKLGLKGFYFYASAPDWYIPKKRVPHDQSCTDCAHQPVGVRDDPIHFRKFCALGIIFSISQFCRRDGRYLCNRLVNTVAKKYLG